MSNTFRELRRRLAVALEYMEEGLIELDCFVRETKDVDHIGQIHNEVKEDWQKMKIMFDDLERYDAILKEFCKEL